MSGQPVSSGDVRELRLALVCYGGVSLAIYMHGITKEIEQLVIASAAFEKDPDGQPPFPEHSSEHAYWNVLRHAFEHGPEARRGVATRVVVDIISGTSAGGINGIALAKAVATNRRQDKLKTVWFEQGDFATLVPGPRRIPPLVRLPVVALWSSVRRRPFSPLRGDAMCRWLFHAFQQMDESPEALPGRDTLVSDNDPSLQLFVPITDFLGYGRRIPLDDPKFVDDQTHRHVLRFDYATRGRDAYRGRANHALAFAARATSSFPGAFAALSVDDYAKAVPDGAELRDVLEELFREYELPADPARTWFVDGGVLDNRPFELAVEAVWRRPASTEVDRRLLFIEPDPKKIQMATEGDADEREPPRAPGWLGTALESVASIPREEPIVDDLLRLAAHNETVSRVREIIMTSFESVAETTVQLATRLGWSDDQWPGTPSLDELRRWRTVLEDAAASDAGLSYTTYLRLRVTDVVDRYAADVAAALDLGLQSYRASLIRDIWRRRARLTGLLATDPDARTQQRQFLRQFDLDYHERHLRFLIAAFSWWYRDQGEAGVPPREELDDAKQAAYRQLTQLRDIRPALGDVQRIGNLREVFAEPQLTTLALERDEGAITRFLEDNQEQLDRIRDAVGVHIQQSLETIESGLYTAMARATASWPKEARRDLLVRYLGFPFWDVLLYPVQALSGAGERDHVEVSRVSPLDARVLSGEGQPERKPLAGIARHHFGAFFQRAGRESDYLWGRLDAAERLISLLLDDPYEPGLQPLDPAQCRAAFEAIIAEEDDLDAAALRDVSQRVQRVGRSPVAPAPPVVEAPGPTAG